MVRPPRSSSIFLGLAGMAMNFLMRNVDSDIDEDFHEGNQVGTQQTLPKRRDAFGLGFTEVHMSAHITSHLRLKLGPGLTQVTMDHSPVR